MTAPVDLPVTSPDQALALLADCACFSMDSIQATFKQTQALREGRATVACGGVWQVGIARDAGTISVSCLAASQFHASELYLVNLRASVKDGAWAITFAHCACETRGDNLARFCKHETAAAYACCILQSPAMKKEQPKVFKRANMKRFEGGCADLQKGVELDLTWADVQSRFSTALPKHRLNTSSRIAFKVWLAPKLRKSEKNKLAKALARASKAAPARPASLTATAASAPRGRSKKTTGAKNARSPRGKKARKSLGEGRGVKRPREPVAVPAAAAADEQPRKRMRLEEFIGFSTTEKRRRTLKATDSAFL